MARRLQVHASTISRHWRANGLKPHVVRGFKVSRDPHFVEKLEDIVGLYMSPPEHALVLCCDEKSQIQALDRTQPGLPIKKGRAQTMTHDYKPNGTNPLVRRPQRSGRIHHRPVPKATHACRMAEIPAPDRRQLRHAQASCGPEVVVQASANPHALHAHIRFLARQPAGATWTSPATPTRCCATPTSEPPARRATSARRCSRSWPRG